MEPTNFWFALDLHGVVHPLGSHPDYDTADDYCEKNNIAVVWLADFSTAMQWCDAIMGAVHETRL
jgi:hypothetical protein